MKPEYRWNHGRGYKSNHHFYNAILKYGWENITHEILATGLTQDQAETLEREYIFQWGSRNPNYGKRLSERSIRLRLFVTTLATFCYRPFSQGRTNRGFAGFFILYKVYKVL